MKSSLRICSGLFFVLFFSTLLYGQENSGKVIIISQSVGEVIDQQEREMYQLFPDIEGFQSARLFEESDQSIRAEITYLEAESNLEKTMIQLLSRSDLLEMRRLISLHDQSRKAETDSSAHPSTPVTQKSVASTDTIVTMELTDGSSFNGQIIEESDQIILFRTVSGMEMKVQKNMVKSIRPLQGKLVEGKYYRLDPNYSRLLFAPTGRPLKKGHGYFSDYYVFFPGISYGITNHITLMGGFTIIPGVSLKDQLKYFAPKIGVDINEKLAFSAGALYGTVENLGAGIGFAVLTVGERDKSFTVGMGLGYTKDEEEHFEFAKHPILMLGGNMRLSNSVALLTENWFVLGETFRISYQPFTIAVRFFGDNLSADVGFIIIGEVIKEGFPIPWLSFVYNFGH